DLRSRFKNINLPSKMSSSITFILTRTEFGKNISHMGVGLLIFGIAAVSTLEKEIIKEVQVGDRFILEGYEITFNGVKREARSNYISDVASLSINGEAGTFVLFPEKRFYSSQETVTSEVAIKKYISQDVYAVLGDFRKPKDSSENYWVLRIYIKPFINFIWFGSFFVALGGFISLFTKKRNFSKNVEI
ncbi:MAG: cytochrome c-type biogenesis CcmF C-terminal domain-containing protein, partial [Paracoccaceae bacterium]